MSQQDASMFLPSPIDCRSIASFASRETQEVTAYGNSLINGISTQLRKIKAVGDTFQRLQERFSRPRWWRYWFESDVLEHIHVWLTCLSCEWYLRAVLCQLQFGAPPAYHSCHFQDYLQMPLKIFPLASKQNSSIRMPCLQAATNTLSGGSSYKIHHFNKGCSLPNVSTWSAGNAGTASHAQYKTVLASSGIVAHTGHCQWCREGKATHFKSWDPSTKIYIDAGRGFAYLSCLKRADNCEYLTYFWDLHFIEIRVPKFRVINWDGGISIRFWIQ